MGVRCMSDAIARAGDVHRQAKAQALAVLLVRRMGYYQSRLMLWQDACKMRVFARCVVRELAS